MAKSKLKIEKNKVADLALAAELCEVNLGDNKVIGDIVVTEVSFKNPSQLFELGRVIDKIKE